MRLWMGLYTMNAGEDVPGSVLKHLLERYSPHFDRTVVLEGRMTEAAEQYYKTLKNVDVVDSPWRDSHLKQYQARMNHIDMGDWMYIPDDDEIPSPELMNFMTNDIRNNKHGCAQVCDVYGLPYIVYITENLIDITKEYYAGSAPPDPSNLRFTRNFLVKKSPNVTHIHSDEFHTNPVPIRGGFSAVRRMPYPAYHMKSAWTYIINDCVNSLVSPRNERFTPPEADRFKTLLAQNGIITMEDLRQSVWNGTWNDDLKQFAIEHRHANDRPISRLYYWYFVLANPDEGVDPEINYDFVVKSALGGWYDYYQAEKEAERSIRVSSTPLRKS